MLSLARPPLRSSARRPARVRALVAAALLAACGRPEPARGLVVLDPENAARPFFHDAGTLEFGARTEWTWSLENTDQAPVTILSATPACHCTRLKDLRAWPAGGGPAIEGDPNAKGALLVVPPLARLELVLGIQTASVLPNQDRLAILRVNTSSPATPFLNFEVHVRARRTFLVKPAEIRIGDMAHTHGGSGSTTIMTGVPDSPARVLSVLETTGGLEAVLDYQFVNQEPVWTLTATVPPGDPEGARGLVHEKVVLATTDAEGEGDQGRLAIEVWANALEDVVIDRRVLLGAIPRDVEKRAEVTVRALVPGMRVRVLSAELSGRDAQSLVVAGFEPRAYADDQGRSNLWSIALATRAGLEPGLLEARLTVRLDDAVTSELSTSVEGVVR